MPSSEASTKGGSPWLLRLVLIVPFVFELVTVVALVGWLALRHGERAVDDVTGQLRDEPRDGFLPGHPIGSALAPGPSRKGTLIA